MLLLGCVADDFTGASDAASFLEKGGLRVLLSNGVPDVSVKIPADVDAVVIALKSRTQRTEDAVRDSMDAFRYLEKQGAQQFYSKYCSTFDSTPKGNIGPIADAAMEYFHVPYTVLCPALPVNGRTVGQGKLFVNGVPLNESSMKDHPLTPMRESSIAKLMKPQSKYPCIELHQAVLRDETRCFAAIEEEKKQASHFYVIPDDMDDADSAQIAELFDGLKLLTGGSGILEPLARKLLAKREETLKKAGIRIEREKVREPEFSPETKKEVRAQEQKQKNQGQKKEKPAEKSEQQEKITQNASQTQELKDARVKTERNDAFDTHVPGPAILLAGSCSKATLGQIAAFQEAGGLSRRIDPEALLDKKDSVEQIWQFVTEHEHQTVLLYSSQAAEQVKKAQSHGKEAVAELLETVMAELGARAAAHGVRRIIVAGGETSGAVTERLGFSVYRIGKSVAPGVPVMEPIEKKDLRLVLKSGNFGAPDFFLRALALTGKSEDTKI